MRNATKSMWSAIFLVIAAALGGCSGLAWEMPDSSNYIHAKAEPVPAYAVGTWTGGMGPYVMTIRVADGGTAILCHSWNHREATGKAKHKDGVFYFSDGSFADLKETASGEPALILSGDEKFTSRLREDSNLTLATPYCVNFFTELQAP